MDLNRNEAQAGLALLAELILVGILAIIAVVVFRQGLELIISLNICAMLLFYRISRSLHQRRLRRRLDEVSSVIHRIGEDMTTKLSTYEGNSDLAKFYNEIEYLRQTLVEREAARQNMMQVADTVATNIEIEKLLDDIMPQVVDATRSACSALYIVNQATNMLEIKHSIGFSKNLYAEFDLSINEGILGITSNSRDIRVLHDVPEDTVFLARTFLGTIKPKSVMAVPVVNQDQLLGVLALVSLYEYTQEHIDSMGLMRYYLGVAVRNGINYEKNKRLTNELKFQNKLIQDLNADLERKVLDRTMFLNDVMDSIKDYAIYALDTKGVIVAWNTGAENLLEFKSAEVIGKHVEILYPNDPERMERINKRIESALANGRFTDSGWRQKQDGTSYHYDMTLFARYSQTGEVVGFTNVTRDTTAYKKSQSTLYAEREFSARVIESVPNALALLDSEGIITVINSGARELLGAAATAGTDFYGLFKNDSDLRGGCEQVLRDGTGLTLTATLRDDKNLSLGVTLIKDAEAIIKMLLVDITACK